MRAPSLDGLLLCALLGAPLGFGLGCSAGTGYEDTGFSCEPGEGTMCSCPGGQVSVSWCALDGSGYLPCECEAGDEGFGEETAGTFDTGVGDGDGDEDSGDGDGDTATGDGDGDGDATTGDGDGDGDTGEPNVEEACYPGPQEDWSVCFPIGTPGAFPDGYDYPPAYQGNINYRAPLRYLDLDTIDPSAQVAPNFTLDELAQSWKGRYVVVQPHAVAYLQDLRDIVGPIVVNSGYRPPGYNAMIGGATSSRHLYGDAFDLDPVQVPLATLEAACTGNDGFLVEYETHVHCDWRGVPVDVGFYGPASIVEPGLAPPVHADLDQDRETGLWTAPAQGFDEGEPVRRWTALAADGQILAEAVGRSFAAPDGATRVEVRVGAQLNLGASVPQSP